MSVKSADESASEWDGILMCTNCGTPVPELVAALREARAEARESDARAENTRRGAEAQLADLRTQRDEARAAIARVREACGVLTRDEAEHAMTGGSAIDYYTGWDSACQHILRALDGDA